MLLETLQIPSVEKVRQHIKADLKRITAWDYSAKDVYDCLVAYLQQYARIRSGVDSFILYIQKAPGISPYVHSVRSRLKLPLHLAEKLVRKCTDENPEKRRTITQDKLFTLEHGITDLGGVRILHLRKGEWNPIHDQLMLIKNFSIRVYEPCARF
jgi:ppGpp synthetase/RelA/SpoT-type nucleotidyltranferase